MTVRWWAVSLLAATAGCESAQTSTARDVVSPPRAQPTTASDNRCGRENAPRPDRDPSAMCWVAPGEYRRIAVGAERLVRVSNAFLIDQHEVTVDQFRRFLLEHGASCPGPLRRDSCLDEMETGVVSRGGRVEVRAGAEQLPIEGAYHHAALAYCAWAGKRLPTEAEWELAAQPLEQRGPDTRRVIPIGTRPQDRSRAGAMDMIGNAPEWVADCFREPVPCSEPCVDPVVLEGCEQSCDGGTAPSRECGDTRVVRRARPHAPNTRAAASPGFSAGFRCAVTP